MSNKSSSSGQVEEPRAAVEVSNCTLCFRQYIIELLLKGLQRLEYRGYDSAGIGMDHQNGSGQIELVTCLNGSKT